MSILHNFFSFYVQEYMCIFMLHVVMANSFTLKVSKPRVYLLALIFSIFIPIIDTLSVVYIGGGIILYNEMIYWILKIGNFFEQATIILFIILVFKEKWYRCYWWSIVLQIALAVPVACTYLVAFTENVDGIIIFSTVDIKSLAEYLRYVLLTVIVGCSFIFIGSRIKKSNKFDNVSKWWFYIINTIFVFVLFYSDKRYGTGNNSVFSNIGNIKLIMFFITILLIILFISINNSDKRLLRLENSLLKQQNEIQYINYLTMQQQETEIHKLYHNIGNHIKKIQILVEQGENEEAKKYTDNVLLEYSDIRKYYFCKNKIINAVLIEKIKLCEQYNIKTDIEIKIPEKLPIRDIDIMSVFANLLDNAIEGCQRSRTIDNHINIKVIVINNYLSLKVVNTKPDDEVIDTKKHLKTWKKDKQMHGIGLMILDEIVERYEGQKELIDLGGEFSALVMLKI